MQRLIPPRLPTMQTLRHRPPLPLHLEQRALIMGTRGRPMALDAGRAGVFLVVDEDHCAECVRRFGRGERGHPGWAICVASLVEVALWGR